MNKDRLTSMPPAPRPVRGPQLITLALLAAVSVVSVPGVLDRWGRYARLHDYAAGPLPEADVSALTAHGAVWILGIPLDALIVTLLPMSLLPWAAAALRNAHAIASGRHFWFTGSNVASGLLVPVANLWWCHLIVADIEKASRPAGMGDGFWKTFWQQRTWRIFLAATAVTAIPTTVVSSETGHQPTTYVDNHPVVTDELVRSRALDAGLYTIQAVLIVLTATLLALAVFRIIRWQDTGTPAADSPTTTPPVPPPERPQQAGRGMLLASSSAPAVLLTLLCAVIPHWAMYAPTVALWVGFVPLIWRTRTGPRIMLILLGAVIVWFIILGIFAIVPLLVTIISGLLAVRAILLESDELRDNRPRSQPTNR